MEGRDDFELMPSPQHLPSEKRRSRVRDGIVDVQNVQLLTKRDLLLLHRQRQGVREVLQQRIRPAQVHFVEIHMLRKAAQPKRRSVGDEMDLVAAARQLQPQLGRHGA